MEADKDRKSRRGRPKGSVGDGVKCVRLDINDDTMKLLRLLAASQNSGSLRQYATGLFAEAVVREFRRKSDEIRALVSDMVD